MWGDARIRSDEALLAELDEAHAEAGRVDRMRLRAISAADRAGAWRGQGHRDHASLLAARYGYSVWKARRLIAAAFAIEHLPLTSAALERGHIGLDNVIELTSFATAASEAELLAWASKVSTTAVRRRADLESSEREKAREIQVARSLTWWWEEGGAALCLEGRLAADDGERFIAAVTSVAEALPVEPPEEGTFPLDPEVAVERKRADALVLLTTSTETGRERSTVVVHAPLEALLSETGEAEIAGGSAIPAATARRIACGSKVEVVLYGEEGDVVGIGRASHDPPPWLRRQVLKRDGHECAFPGCDMRRYLHLHHIEWWHEGGHTNLDNLITLCHFHHKLVHEYGWRVRLEPAGPRWERPGGRRYEPGRAPPEIASRTDDDIPWGSLWHALKTADLESKDGFFFRWSMKRGVDWVPAEGNTAN